MECLLDPGCEVVAMSERIALKHHLEWDPSLRIPLTSANGTTDWSCGTAQDVHFTFGGITSYLQVHILPAASYDVLLGRPFDRLLATIVRNFPDGSQTITLHDPNSRHILTFATWARGELRAKLRNQESSTDSQNFQAEPRTR